MRQCERGLMLIMSQSHHRGWFWNSHPRRRLSLGYTFWRRALQKLFIDVRGSMLEAGPHP